MNLQTQIRQQQSTVQMLEKLLRAKRCSQADVDQANRRLADLQQQVDFKPLSYPGVQPPAQWPPVPTAPVATGRAVEGDEYISLQAELSQQADRLNRKMADLSNKFHQVPASANCPELTRPILQLKAEIEAVWDKKRYLERNRMMPDESTADEPADADRPATLEDRNGRYAGAGPAGRFELAYQKRRLIDLRSKLKRKLADPKAKPGKRHEWETELAKADLEIQEIEIKLG